MFIAVLNFRCEFCAVFCYNEMRLFIMFQVDDEAVNEIMPAVTSTSVPHECIMIHWHPMHLSSPLAWLCSHLAVSSPVLLQECICSSVTNMWIFHSHLQISSNHETYSDASNSRFWHPILHILYVSLICYA